MSVHRLRLAAFAVLIATSTALSQGITVTAEGRASRPANTVEIRGTIEGRAELPGDAFVKYGQALARFTKKLGELDAPGLAIERLGPRIGIGFAGQDEGGMNAIMLGMNGGDQKLDPEVAITERLVLRLPLQGLDAERRSALLGEIIEACRENGVRHPNSSNDPQLAYIAMVTGQGSPTADAFSEAGAISYRCDDEPALYADAVAAAVKSASRAATAQAKAVGRELGEVTSMETLLGDEVKSGATETVSHRIRLKITFGLR
ncbi:MAG: SIMPL domain-containing protein [Planctomycetota bacterium]